MRVTLVLARACRARIHDSKPPGGSDQGRSGRPTPPPPPKPGSDGEVVGVAPRQSASRASRTRAEVVRGPGELDEVEMMAEGPVKTGRSATRAPDARTRRGGSEAACSELLADKWCSEGPRGCTSSAR